MVDVTDGEDAVGPVLTTVGLVSVSDDTRLNREVNTVVGDTDDVAPVAEGTKVRVAVLRSELDAVGLVSVRGDEDEPMLALELASVNGKD